jgi:hypothetical protein
MQARAPLSTRAQSTARLTHAKLKVKQRNLRDGFPTDLALRVHRALSWLDRAERAAGDNDIVFVCNWIAFNAAYADELGESTLKGERSAFDEYFGRLTAMDRDTRIYAAIWDRYSQSIRLLLDNHYVFQPFWKHQNRVPGYADWETRFMQSKHVTKRALENRDTSTILSILFDRLYVLRNQILHGGSTWNGNVNRNQVRDGATILGALVPIFVDLMMDNPDVVWGASYYPVVESESG